MRIAAFFNLRGGTGKTTFLLHLASICAREHGLRVLVADADPQRNASFHSLAPGALRGLGPGFLRRVLSLGEDPDPIPFLTTSPHFGFDLLPGDTSLMEALPRLEAVWSRGDARSALDLRRVLLRLAPRYDLVFLDVAPGRNALARAGLIAADGFICPFGMRRGDLEDLRAVKDWILDWERPWRAMLEAPDRREAVRARFLGCLANRVSVHDSEHRLLVEAADRLALAMAQELGDHRPGAPCILGAAPDFGARSLAAQRAKQPIFLEAAPGSREIFLRASRRLLDSLNLSPPQPHSESPTSQTPPPAAPQTRISA